MDSQAMSYDTMEMAMSRHYFRRLDSEQPRAILEHKLGRFPRVDVYTLDDIPDQPSGTRFLVFYGHDEMDVMIQKLWKVPRPILGTRLEQLLPEYRVKWEDDDSLGDVVNDFLDAFFQLPAADEMSHKSSKWIDDHLDKTIGELKKRDEWDDVRWLVLPKKLVVGSPEAAFTPLVNVEQLSYDALAVFTNQVPPANPIDLMIVLKR